MEFHFAEEWINVTALVSLFKKREFLSTGKCSFLTLNKFVTGSNGSFVQISVEI